MSEPITKTGDPFLYTSRNLTVSQRRWQRVFEGLPGAISWLLIVGAIALSWLNPAVAIVGIIVFDLFWLFFMAYSLILIVSSLLRLRIEQDTDWMARVRDLEDDEVTADGPVAPAVEFSRNDTPAIFQKISEALYRSKRNRLSVRTDHLRPPPGSIHHVVIFSISGEDRGAIKAAVESMLSQDFPLDRVMVILAANENAPRQIKETAWELHREHFERFAGFYVAPHPAGESEELPIKGAAVNFAARMAVAALEQKGIDPASVVVSCLEASAVPHARYLSCLTWNYLACADRDRTCFQPVPVHHENIWNAPAFASILNVGSSFLLPVEATNPDGLVTFASYSMSLQTLIDVDYWPEEEALSDDSAFFWKAFLHFDGGFQVVPIYTPLALDLVREGPFRKTVADVYRRKKREAWAIRNLPVILRGFLQSRRIPIVIRLWHGVKMLQKHVATATWVFLLLLVGWLPGIAAAHQGANSTLSYVAPRIHGVIFCLVFLGLAIAAIVSVWQLPRRLPAHRSPGNGVRQLAAWLAMPLLALALTACPYLDVQTRLLLGMEPNRPK